LNNHLWELVALDFFVVPTATFRILFGFIVLGLDRRQVLHFNVTTHPTAEWTSRQIVEARRGGASFSAHPRAGPPSA